MSRNDDGDDDDEVGGGCRGRGIQLVDDTSSTSTFFLFEFRGLHCSSRLFGLRPGWAVRGYKQMEIAM